MRENEFQAKLIKDIKARIPGAIVLKNDANYIQGIPDLTVFFDGGQAVLLECKRSKNAPHQQNQDYYISVFNKMGFYATFIYPENKEEILDAMERAYTA